MTSQDEIAISITDMITVKNTFLDIKKFAEEPVRRSSSVPRTFRPSTWDSLPTDVSANAPKEGMTSGPVTDDADTVTVSSLTSDSEQDWPDYSTECTDDDDYMHQCFDCASESHTDETQKNRVTLSLDDMVTAESKKARAKLRSQAVPFKSARAPPAEMAAAITSAVEALSSGEGIIDVQVNDGGMGGTTTIVAKTSCSKVDAFLLVSLVKDTLLKSAELSENTYIMGYGSQPFKNLDTLSFSASIGCVPQAHQDTACWDMYEHGYCPRRSTCRWDHPTEVDMMRIIVMLKVDA